MTAGPVPAYSYIPGDWTVLVRGRILAALPAGTDPATVGAVWDAMDDDAGIAQLLPLVSGGAGAEPATMPPFALASTADGLHVILRGHVTLTVAGSTGSATYAGERALTWAEHLLDDAYSSFTLICGPPAGTESSLPLVGGAVLAGSIRATPAGSDPGAGVPARAAVDADARAPAAADAGPQRAGAVGPDRAARTVVLPDAPLAEPGGLGAMDPELEAEPSPAVGEQPEPLPAHPAADPADGDDATGPGFVLTSVPADVADPSVASAVEPLAPTTSPADAEPQKEG